MKHDPEMIERVARAIFKDQFIHDFGSEEWTEDCEAQTLSPTCVRLAVAALDAAFEWQVMEKEAKGEEVGPRTERRECDCKYSFWGFDCKIAASQGPRTFTQRRCTITEGGEDE